MGAIKDLGMQAAQGAIGGAMGIGEELLMGNYRRKKQLEQQKKLTDMQVNANKNLADYGMAISKEMFEATGYGAQRRQMEEAGLNPALMYGHAGAGGSTQSAGAGSAGAGQASSGSEYAGKANAMGIEMMRAQSEIAVNKSIAEKNQAEADATRGYKKEQAEAQTKNIEEVTKNTQVQRQGINLQNDYDKIRNYIAESSFDYNIEALKWMAGKAREEFEIILNNKEISNATKDLVIESYELNNKNIGIEILNKKAGIELTEAQAEKAYNDIAQGWEDLRIKDTQGTRDLNIKSEANRIKQAYPSLGQMSGGAVQEVLMFLDKINPFGGKGKGFGQSLGKE